MELKKEGSGYRYMVKSGGLVASGWARGTRRDAEREAASHLADLRSEQELPTCDFTELDGSALPRWSNSRY